MPRARTVQEILEKPFLSEGDLEQLGLRSRKTSQNLRYSGREFLPYVRFGRSVRYPASAVWAYLRKTKVVPEAE